MIDPRIALLGNQFDAKRSLDIFQNFRNGVQNRKISDSNLETQALQRRATEQAIQQNEDAALQAIDNRRLSTFAQTAQLINPLIQDGKLQEAKGVLEQNLIGLSEEDKAEALEGLINNPQQLQRVGETSIKALENRRALSQRQNKANFQFGAQKTFKDSQGRVFFGTTRNDPNTGESSPVLVAADGSGATPQGAIQETGSFGQTAQENIINKGRITQAQEAAKSNSALGSEQIRKLRITTDETKVKNEQAKQDLIAQKQTALTEANNAISVIDELLKDDNFDVSFGAIDGAIPDSLKSQSSIDVRAQVEQVVGLISLESRQKLKGQGNISDSETKSLEKSATILANPRISDKLARKELRKVRGIFESAADRSRLKPETRQEIQQQSNQSSVDLNSSTEDLLKALNE